MLVEIGMILIASAWIYQSVMAFKKHFDIERIFLMLYSLGVIFLVIADFETGFSAVTWLNLAVLLMAGLVLFKMGLHKTKPVALNLEVKKVLKNPNKSVNKVAKSNSRTGKKNPKKVVSKASKKATKNKK
jgi:trehalose utilization protein